MRVVEGALLDIDPETVRAALEGDGAFLAVDGGRAVGAIVCEGSRVVAVAVVAGRRGEGVGRALVERADGTTAGALEATFDRRARGFYESLGFEVEAVDGRYRGVRR
jgi:GNAT superfamily N-acetyltransferase